MIKRKPISLLVLFIFFFSAAFTQNADSTKPQTAIIGMHLMNIYELDMSTNSFYADFYLWCRWKDDIDPLKDLEFLNSEDQWGFAKTMLYDTTQLLEDSSHYNIMHVQGRFHHSFILNNYPVDEQNISIVIENSIYTSHQLLYIPDTANSNLQPDISIPGWQIAQFSMKASDHVYTTNFGQPEIANNDSYCSLRFSLSISRPLQFFIWKLLLPIMIVLMSSLGATLIFPKYTDARIYAPVGALLTTVFLQQSYSANLPDISYLVLTDKIYVVVYIGILAGIFQAIITANMVKDDTPESYARAKKLDKIYIISFSIFLIGAIGGLIFFR